MANAITNRDDVIDSRDVIERIEELTSEIDDELAGEGENELDLSDIEVLKALNLPNLIDEVEELITLLELQDEAEGYAPDWHYGAQLIRDSYFQEYAEQLAADIGAIDRNAKWPINCIDWEQAARPPGS